MELREVLSFKERVIVLQNRDAERGTLWMTTYEGPAWWQAWERDGERGGYLHQNNEECDEAATTSDEADF